MMTSDNLEGRLKALAGKIAAGASLEDFRALTGGSSLEAIAFRINLPDGTILPLLLRRLPPGQAPLMNSVALSTEAHVIRLVGSQGVPVAGVRYVCCDEDGLGDGFVADFVTGETVPRKILRDETFTRLRAGFAAECGRILARIHAVDASHVEGLQTITAEAQLESMERSYRSRTFRSPVFEVAFKWLHQRKPAFSSRPGLVHGDFRMGNILVGPDSIRAVLDWELTHLGDPAEDLGWLTVNSWRFGQIDQPVGGVSTVAELLQAYRDAGGRDISHADLLFWRALGSLRWGVACGEMSHAFVEGRAASVERGMIGRRVSETEIDLLDILTTGDADV